MNIAICEDETPQRKQLASTVNTWARLRGVSLTIHEYANAESIFFNLGTNGPFDLFFLDIEMGNGNATGLDVARELRTAYGDVLTPIIFVTSHPEYVFSGYKVQALDYLVKPIAENELTRLLDQVYAGISDVSQSTLLVNTPTAAKRIPYRLIRYIESQSHFVELQVINSEAERFRGNISELEAQLPPELFVRTHRSYIVNSAHVVSVSKGKLTMDDDTVIPISRSKQHEVDEHILFLPSLGERAVSRQPTNNSYSLGHSASGLQKGDNALSSNHFSENKD
jgi:DNA-binding LytR/AlgR family response regulator